MSVMNGSNKGIVNINLYAIHNACESGVKCIEAIPTFL
jgi:hypothetical protein